MAHAARLSLRMQKELKLLATDPPPGVSLSLLSHDSTGNNPSSSSFSSSSSLSSIDASIEGPEGTVYAKGVFNVRIQVPERYPFQPPNVTFVTPIYHPNIDNGGRICLDILNLPPKGAWQPSLNISTVLTSIGLLLSEPNPDDGLMCEASREYKYNRQAFDQKARHWTERYAKTGIGGNTSYGSDTVNSTMVDIYKADTTFATAPNEDKGCMKRVHGISKKLSLKSLVSSEKTSPYYKENTAPVCRLSLTHSKSIYAGSVMSLSLPQVGNGDEELPHQYHDEKTSNGRCKQQDQAPMTLEMVIVSDSEESEEEEKPKRPRMSFIRKHLAGKIKS